ncbi:geranylgeranyl transferase type I beta subunit [Stachybotrys elegans]|uniref:Geranylgeranyl transferase type I beta subunit n=1 Tax=Stachybotrys elegans TaxID=80388 RepID=A0A8K0WNL9_9HYPO|nr:geranylgeranyl transferase type I beta subunit [Stachybotrys elegans]
MTAPDASSLQREKHIKYWQRCYTSFLPSAYTSNDSTRLTFACFIVSALDLLSVPLPARDRAAIRTWVLSLQHPDGGFCGSPTHALPGQRAHLGTANLAATFFALVLLGLAAEPEEAAARAAFVGVRRARLLRWLRRLQREDGSFGQNLWDGEPVGGKDMRHSYLASSIRWMLRAWERPGEDVDVDSMVAYIRQGQTYDGGLAESSLNESHAGYAFCGVATLAMLDRQSSTPAKDPESAVSRGIPDREALIKFLVCRQFAYLAKEEEDDVANDDSNFIQAESGALAYTHVGFNGRWNKKADTCYFWWVGGTLMLLDEAELINTRPACRYVLDITQHAIGGFGKAGGSPPDVFHSYLGLAALTTMGQEDLKPFDVGICCSKEVADKIQIASQGLLQLIEQEEEQLAAAAR